MVQDNIMCNETHQWSTGGINIQSPVYIKSSNQVILVHLHLGPDIFRDIYFWIFLHDLFLWRKKLNNLNETLQLIFASETSFSTCIDCLLDTIIYLSQGMFSIVLFLIFSYCFFPPGQRGQCSNNISPLLWSLSSPIHSFVRSPLPPFSDKANNHWFWQVSVLAQPGPEL